MRIGPALLAAVGVPSARPEARCWKLLGVDIAPEETCSKLLGLEIFFFLSSCETSALNKGLWKARFDEKCRCELSNAPKCLARQSRTAAMLPRRRTSTHNRIAHTRSDEFNGVQESACRIDWSTNPSTTAQSVRLSINNPTHRSIEHNHRSVHRSSKPYC